MRIAVCLALALCAAPAAHAQGVIEWSSERRLARTDFKGRVPADASKTSLSWLNIETAWECKGNALLASARVTFDPARSWWLAASGNIWEGGDRSGGVDRAHLDARRSVIQRNLQLLEHEQLHFDLAEIAVRKIRSRFADLKDACDGAPGPDGLHDEIMTIERALQEQQGRYDAETRHGTSATVQDRWRQTIRQQLDLAPRPQTPAPRRRR